MTGSIRYAPSAPDLRWQASQGQFLVVKGFTACWVRPGHPVLFVRVPKGFQTDLASIPQAFRWLIPQIGKHLPAAIVHDCLYNCSMRKWYKVNLTREEVDQMFLDGMRHLSVSLWRRNLMHWAVRRFGAASWEEKT